MTWPVYIPSKGRPGGSTAALLRAAGVAHTLVVEPQEAEAYERADGAHGSHVAVLAEANRGLPYSRNQTMTRARAAGYRWFWMMDDDVTAFYETRAKKNHRVPADVALRGAEALLEPTSLAQGALEYQQFAWSASRAIAPGSYCDVVVCFNLSRLGERIAFRDLPLKLDRDMTLQILASGRTVGRVTQFSFAAPKNGSNDGGLKPVYDVAGREQAECEQMARLWPGVCTPVVKPDGRRDVKINWRALRPG